MTAGALLPEPLLPPLPALAVGAGFAAGFGAGAGSRGAGTAVGFGAGALSRGGAGATVGLAAGRALLAPLLAAPLAGRAAAGTGVGEPFISSGGRYMTGCPPPWITTAIVGSGVG
jgi:hypothetical protein